MSGVSTESDLVDATAYRVHIVRLWGRMFLDGIQFVYKHETTGELLEGPRRATPLVDVVGATDLYEFTLYPHEYIVAVRGREGMWTDAIELETVCHRIFRVGGSGGQPFVREVSACAEIRFLVCDVGQQLTSVQPWVATARYTLPIQVTNSFYQLVLRDPAFRVSAIQMWNGLLGFAGLRVTFQRKVAPFDHYDGILFGETWCNGVDPAVCVDLLDGEFVAMTLCRVDDEGGILELRLRTNYGRNISCGNTSGRQFVFACHTLANCEVRGLRSAMTYSPRGLNIKLEMHEIRRTGTFDVAAFDAAFSGILLHAVAPEAAVAAGIPPPPTSYDDDQQDEIDFEDETFDIPESVYECGIPSIEDVESCKWELEQRLMAVRRNNDECRMIVDGVIVVYDKILALHNRQIAYAGLLVLRLLDLLRLTTTALEKSTKMFSLSGRNKRMEHFGEVQSKVFELLNDLERFTLVEAKFAKHALTEGKNESLDAVISETVLQGDIVTARKLYLDGIATVALETARDSLLVALMQQDNLETFVEILQAKPGFKINQDGRSGELANQEHSGYGCDLCSALPIMGRRYRSLRYENFDACQYCYSPGSPSPYAPFVLAIDKGGVRFVEQDSLLAVAIGLGAFRIVEWLVCHFNADPFAKTMHGCTAVEYCNTIDWIDNEQREKMQLLMTQYKRRREFLSATSALLKYSRVSFDDLAKLVVNITSVYDLRTMFTFGSANLDNLELKRLLILAFEHVMSEKLVLDDEASLFFDLVLAECKKRGLLNDIEVMRWSRDNVRVNMENATWVKEIKQSIHKLTEQVENVDRQLEAVKRNVNDLKDALVAKEENEIRREKCKRIVSFLSMGLCMVAGPVFEQCFNAVIDFAVPIKLLLATIKIDEDKVAEFLADKAADYVCNDGIEAILMKAQVDTKDFVDLLREVVVLEQPDLTPSQSAGSTAAVAPQKHANRPMSNDAGAKSEEPREAKGKMTELTKAMKSVDLTPKPKPAPSTAVSVAPRSLGTTSGSSSSFALTSVDVEELEKHEFHHAVYHSEGDLETFKELLELVEDQDLVNNEMEVEVINKGEPQRVRVQPQVLASYLGYFEIAEYFFKHVPQLTATERKITTLTRAKKASSARLASGGAATATTA